MSRYCRGSYNASETVAAKLEAGYFLSATLSTETLSTDHPLKTVGHRAARGIAESGDLNNRG